MEEKVQQLKTRLGEISDLRKASALLGWDQQTYMPPGGAAARAEQLATLHKTAHNWFIADEVGELIESLCEDGSGWDYDSDEASLVRVAARDYEKARKVPGELVAEFARVTALGQSAGAIGLLSISTPSGENRRT
jgi:carboxypeptidase Taq